MHLIICVWLVVLCLNIGWQVSFSSSNLSLFKMQMLMCGDKITWPLINNLFIPSLILVKSWPWVGVLGVCFFFYIYCVSILLFYWSTGINMASQPVAQSQVPVTQQQATPTPMQATPSPPQTTPQHAQLFVQQQNTSFFTAQQQVTATWTILEIIF